MGYREESTKEALANGVMGAFGDKYGEKVKVYTVGDPDGNNYSREICGGPHVSNTGKLAEDGKVFALIAHSTQFITIMVFGGISFIISVFMKKQPSNVNSK